MNWMFYGKLEEFKVHLWAIYSPPPKVSTRLTSGRPPETPTLGRSGVLKQGLRWRPSPFSNWVQPPGKHLLTAAKNNPLLNKNIGVIVKKKKLDDGKKEATEDKMESKSGAADKKASSRPPPPIPGGSGLNEKKKCYTFCHAWCDYGSNSHRAI